MDDIDMALIRALWEDSRISFNQLGKNLQISGNILKKRADRLEQEGIFIYHANPVFSQFGFGLVDFEIDLPKQNRQYYIDTISSNFEEIYSLILTLSSKCSINTLLPFNSEKGVSKETIEDFKNRFHAKIKNIQINRHYKLEYFYGNYDPKPVEIRLIRLLREYSRFDLNEISEKLKLSKKTLSRYLLKFSQNNLIKHTIGLYPSKIRGFLVHILFVEFKNDKNLRTKIVNLKKKINWLSFYILIEPPGVMFYVYSETIADMENCLKKLYDIPEIKDINLYFPSSIIRYERWKEFVIPEQTNNG